MCAHHHHHNHNHHNHHQSSFQEAMRLVTELNQSDEYETLGTGTKLPLIKAMLRKLVTEGRQKVVLFSSSNRFLRLVLAFCVDRNDPPLEGPLP
eukprot:GHVU01015707.1.p1 GENE.GHVU01015707.1~~GHVU01015707.1.p1  ORF type:complete len:108 (+),score=14.05 GHVU01015707.1:43-324(+)